MGDYHRYYTICRTDDQINKVMDLVADGLNNGTAYPGASYEEGIQAFFDWIIGNTTVDPFE